MPQKDLVKHAAIRICEITVTEDLLVQLVRPRSINHKKPMTCKRFTNLKDMINFCNNDNFDNKNYRTNKVCPLITAIKESFKRFEILQKDILIDEKIVKYYGHI